MKGDHFAAQIRAVVENREQRNTQEYIRAMIEDFAPKLREGIMRYGAYYTLIALGEVVKGLNAIIDNASVDDRALAMSLAKTILDHFGAPPTHMHSTLQ